MQEYKILISTVKQFLTSKVLAGVTTVTDAVACGTKRVIDATVCGYDLATIAVKCGWLHYLHSTYFLLKTLLQCHLDSNL